MTFDPFKPWVRGDLVTAARLESMRLGTVQTVQDGNGVTAQKRGTHLSIQGPPNPRDLALTNCYLMRVEALPAHSPDVMLCRVIIGDISGALFWVAKPYLLRPSIFDGESVTYSDGVTTSYVYESPYVRAALTDGNEEVQRLTPGWFVGEHIRAIQGATGVVDPDGAPVLWEDINSAGRHWGSLGNLFDFFRYADVGGVQKLCMNVGTARAVFDDESTGVIDQRLGVSGKSHSGYDYGDFPEGE